jgi:hypothetical protein
MVHHFSQQRDTKQTPIAGSLSLQIALLISEIIIDGQS